MHHRGLINYVFFQASIIRMAENVCAFMSVTEKQLQCKSVVKIYAPAVFELLYQMDNPDTICKNLNACSVQSSLISDLRS